MRQNGSTPRSTVATASRVETTHTKSIYAADMSTARPLSAAHRRLVADNPRSIRVGHVEKTPFGTLRCFRAGDDVVIAMRKGRTAVGRRLILRHAAVLGDGPFDEADFSVEVDEFIGTPWHELEYTSLWTVYGLRTKGQMEATVDR